ncbi:copper transporter [uncultured Tissierella sp.]|uniref:copper transporter n=1 Tax=Tissierella sp. TaxID=41274 RepID=UPI0028044823|nr:copper transporter [uncultured Tissierella sp.]MDU5080009.1 copper transporter [Bacillota bacterium]
MLPSMRFYIISIVSIFVALGIGIFIGFTMDTQEFVIEQQEIINEIIESQFETLINENKELKANVNTLESENEYKDEYINLSYESIIKGKLEGLKVGIIETSEDYVTSGIGRDLEMAGAKVINVTTLNNNIIDKEKLSNLYKRLNINVSKNPAETTITTITESIISGVSSPMFEDLEKEGFIETIGNYEEDIDYLIICGGSHDDNSKRINQVDRIIVGIAKKYNIPIIGVEKSNVNYSYMSGYKDLDISTVDNVDMTIGKVAMILAMEGIGGHYGIKNTADGVIPYFNKE